MLEAKYYKDHRHNYMILRCEREEITGSYQHKILISDKIGDILKCSVRHINGAVYYYYDISSRTTLEGLYRGKQMSYAQVKDVLYQLYGICEKLAGYFMEETKLVLQPEHIYYDITNHKYIGLYYPDYEAEEAETYKPLMDFLLEHIDTDDTKLTENIYRLYEMVEERHFCIEDALRILEDGEQPVYEMFRGSEQIPAEEVLPKQTLDESAIYSTEQILQTEMPQSLQTEMTSIDKAGCGKRDRKSLFYSVFMVLLLFGIAGDAVVYYMYELTQEEQFVLLGSAVVLGICLLICLLGIVRGSRKKPNGREGSGWGADRNMETVGKSKREPDREYFVNDEILSLDHVISRDMSLEMAEHKPADYQVACCNQRASYHMRSNFIQENENCGNTIFFDESKMEEFKLYAVDKKNKKHIELKQFPCTVGKMEGCVDYVLSDDSVSRIHARFDKQGEKILMTDMNSTNGTYKNGLRMQPQETVEIEPGDEVRFGSLNYCYR